MMWNSLELKKALDHYLRDRIATLHPKLLSESYSVVYKFKLIFFLNYSKTAVESAVILPLFFLPNVFIVNFPSLESRYFHKSMMGVTKQELYLNFSFESCFTSKQHAFSKEIPSHIHPTPKITSKMLRIYN